jgi:hypothetical protein
MTFAGLENSTVLAYSSNSANVKLTFPQTKPITLGSKMNFTVFSKPKVKIKYASSSAKIATVDAQGVVTGVGIGHATITATVVQSGYRGQSSFTVTIVPKPIDERLMPAQTDYNMINDGYMVEDDQSLYYIQMEKHSSFGGPIYKLDKNDSKRKQLLYKGKAMYMVKQGEWIYFSERNDYDLLYKIKADGSKLTKLSVYSQWTWTPVNHLTIAGNWIYYGSKGQINKILIDGTKEQVVFEDPEMSNFFISNGMFYYVFLNKDGETGIRKVKIGQTTSQLVVRMNSFIGNIAVKDDWIYYMSTDNQFGFYRIRTDGTSKTLLTQGNEATLFGDWIYYVDTDTFNEYCWYRMKLDGSGMEKIASIVPNVYDNGSHPLMLGGKLYYKDEDDFADIYEVDENGHRRSINGKLYVRTVDQLLDAQRTGLAYTLAPDDEEMKLNEKAVAKAKEILAQIITTDMTEDQKLKAVHDYIVLNTAYDYDNYVKDTIPDSSGRFYGVLLNHIAVCDGYARTLKLFMDILDIENYYVYGTILASGKEHAWNVVNIDGKYYQVDTTWDDPVPDLAGRLSYDYYKLTDTQMSSTRKWDHSLAPAAN